MPPKTARRNRQGAESRRRILDAALGIATERGYDGTTVALVTERTGLPASSVYWHFHNKDELLAEALEHAYRLWLSASDDWTAFEVGMSGAERVRRRPGQNLRRLLARPEFWRLGLMVGLLEPTTSMVARERYLEVRRDALARTSVWWSECLEPDLAARRPDLRPHLSQLIINATDGLFLAAQSGGSWDVEALADDVGSALMVMVSQPRRRPSVTHAAGADDVSLTPPVGSRERLLAAAGAVAAERGYVGTTIALVCERSGLPVSSLYWFFDDKDHLMSEVVQHSFDDWLARQPRWTRTSDARRATTLRRILRQTTRTFDESPAFLRVGHMVALEHQAGPTGARRRFVAIREGVETDLSAWFAHSLMGTPVADDADLPRTLAQLLIALTDGLFLSQRLDDWEIDLDVTVDGFVEILEQVVARRTADATSGRAPTHAGSESLPPLS